MVYVFIISVCSSKGTIKRLKVPRAEEVIMFSIHLTTKRLMYGIYKYHLQINYKQWANQWKKGKRHEQAFYKK